MILVSKCLAGFSCRYDGCSKPDRRITELVSRGLAVPVCPEELGGLTTPRLPTELTATGEQVLLGCGRAVMRDGTDVTREFINGAYAALRIARDCGAERAILKAKSPSCGNGLIYDGSFTGTLKEGSGVAAALLKKNGIQVDTV